MSARRTAPRIARAAALAIAALSAACAPRTPSDLLVISIDTLRADRLGAYGNPDRLTPHLDALAEGGVLFEDATAPAPLTLPSHATLFTGRYPTATGVRNNGSFVLPPSETTLAEILSGAGWRTGAVVASHPLVSRYGLAQGFEVYDDALPPPSPSSDGAMPIYYAERPADAVTDRALEVWRGLAGDGPRFLWVHYFDPHAPYLPPDPWSGRTGPAAYDGEVAFVDREVGRLLAALRADAPGLLVAVVSDHGEALGEHGEKTHGVFLYQGTMHVPFVLHGPGIPRKVRAAPPVSLADLLPTVLGALRLAVPAGVQGADLRPVWESGPPPSRPVYAESFLPRLQFRFHELTLLRRGRLKYVQAPVPELYDLGPDPGERRNLHGGHPEEPALAADLEAFAGTADPAASERAAGALDAEAEARLRSLGYASAGTLRTEGDPSAARDPKTMVGYLERYDRSVGMIASGRRAEGIALLRELAPEAPENTMVHYQIAAGLLADGRFEEAEAAARTVVEAMPEFDRAYLLLGGIQGRLGRYDEAIRSFRAGAEVSPRQSAPLTALAEFLHSIGRFEESGAAWLEALEREPADAEAARGLMSLRVSRGERARGLEELAALAARHPDAAPLWIRLAAGRRELGDGRGAREALVRARALAPGHPEVLLITGEVALEDGDAAAAESAFAATLRAAPRARAARLGRARALVALGRREEAEAEVEEVLRQDPGNRAALELRSSIVDGRL